MSKPKQQGDVASAIDAIQRISPYLRKRGHIEDYHHTVYRNGGVSASIVRLRDSKGELELVWHAVLSIVTRKETKRSGGVHVMHWRGVDEDVLLAVAELKARAEERGLC